MAVTKTFALKFDRCSPSSIGQLRHRVIDMADGQPVGADVYVSPRTTGFDVSFAASGQYKVQVQAIAPKADPEDPDVEVGGGLEILTSVEVPDPNMESSDLPIGLSEVS